VAKARITSRGGSVEGVTIGGRRVCYSFSSMIFHKIYSFILK